MALNINKKIPFQKGRGYDHAISKCAYGNTMIIIDIAEFGVKEKALCSFYRNKELIYFNSRCAFNSF